MKEFELEDAVRLYGPKLFRYVYTILCDYQETEDVTVLETTKGDIELKGNNFSRPNPTGPFELVWYASSTVDLDSITAVRIGDNRIELNS